MRKTHLTAYKLSLASIFYYCYCNHLGYIHNTQLDIIFYILIVYFFKYLFFQKISGVHCSAKKLFFNVLKSFSYFIV